MALNEHELRRLARGYRDEIEILQKKIDKIRAASDQPAPIRVEVTSYLPVVGRFPHIDLTWHSGDKTITGTAMGITEDLHIDLHIKAPKKENQ